jgi:ABC-type Na+ efflux pump permease subunit
MVRTSGLLAALVLVLQLAGMASPGAVAFFYATIGLSFLVGIATNVVRDRIDGGLEFVVSLPVRPRLVAGARMAACALVAVPAASLITLALVLTIPPATGQAPTGTGAARLLVGVWVAGSVGAGLLQGSLVRFTHETLARLPLVAMALIIVVAAGTDRLFPHLDERLTALAGEPWVPALMSGVTVVGALGGLALAYWLLEGGIRRFRPGRDRITW